MIAISSNPFGEGLAMISGPPLYCFSHAAFNSLEHTASRYIVQVVDNYNRAPTRQGNDHPPYHR
jgi:hypothetical protein